MSEDTCFDDYIHTIRSISQRLSSHDDFRFLEIIIAECAQYPERQAMVDELRTMYRSIYWAMNHNIEDPRVITLGKQSVIPIPNVGQLEEGYQFMAFLGGINMKQKLPNYLRDSRVLLNEFLRMKGVEVTRMEEILQNYQNSSEFKLFCDTYLKFHSFYDKCQKDLTEFSEDQKSILMSFFPLTKQKFLKEERSSQDNLFNVFFQEALSSLENAVHFDEELLQQSNLFFEELNEYPFFKNRKLEKFLNDAKFNATDRKLFEKIKPCLEEGIVPFESTKKFFSFINRIYSLDEDLSRVFFEMYRNSLIQIYVNLSYEVNGSFTEKHSENKKALGGYLSYIDWFEDSEFTNVSPDILICPEFAFLTEDLKKIRNMKLFIGDDVLDATSLFQFLEKLEICLNNLVSIDNYYLISLQNVLISLSLECKRNYGPEKTLQDLLGNGSKQLENVLEKLTFISPERN